MTKWTGEPLKLEDNGQYLAACDLYVNEAIAALIEHDYRPWGGGGAPIGFLLGAISAARRGEARDRSQYLQRLLETSLAYSKEAAGQSDPALEAYCEEWLADSYLMLGSESAVEFYEQALVLFSETDSERAHSWSQYLGNEYQSTALFRLLEHEGIEVDREALSSSDYETRLRHKAEVADTI